MIQGKPNELAAKAVTACKTFVLSRQVYDEQYKVMILPESPFGGLEEPRLPRTCRRAQAVILSHPHVTKQLIRMGGCFGCCHSERSVCCGPARFLRGRTEVSWCHIFCPRRRPSLSHPGEVDKILRVRCESRDVRRRCNELRLRDVASRVTFLILVCVDDQFVIAG